MKFKIGKIELGGLNIFALGIVGYAILIMGVVFYDATFSTPEKTKICEAYYGENWSYSSSKNGCCLPDETKIINEKDGYGIEVYVEGQCYALPEKVI